MIYKYSSLIFVLSFYFFFTFRYFAIFDIIDIRTYVRIMID